MNRLKLSYLVAGLALGNLMGCSKASTKLPDASVGIRAGGEVAERRQAVAPGTTLSKPSAYIKWDKGSGRPSKPLRQAKRAVPKDLAKKLQAKNAG